MILVIPSIEIENGRCKYCICGETESEKWYRKLSYDPCELSKLLRKENAKSIHIGIKQDINDDLIKMTILTAKQLDIPIIISSQFNNIDECISLLENGIYRIVIENPKTEHKSGYMEIIKKYTPSRIAFRAVTENNIIISNPNMADCDIFQFIDFISEIGANRIIFSKTEWNDNISISQVDSLREFAEQLKIKITVVGGIQSTAQLLMINALQIYGIDSIILGRALYNNRFPCQEIWRKIESEIHNN